MAETEPSKRRNSLERYKPRQSTDEITDDINNFSLSEDSSSNNQKSNRRRGVNNHLYSGRNHGDRDRENSSRGRGRGRGRGRSLPQENGFNTNRDERPREDERQERPNNNSNNNSNWNRDNRSAHSKWSQDDRSMKFQINGNNPHNQNQNHRNFHDNRPLLKRNTETFKPSHKPSDMRILAAYAGWKRYAREMTSRDVLVVHDLFCSPDDLTIYNKLLNEIKQSGIEETDLWQLWHGDSHVIADDKKRWKDSCPTFHMVLDKIRGYFQMDIKGIKVILTLSVSIPDTERKLT